MSNDKKRKKLIIAIVIALAIVNILVFSILFLDLSKYIWPEVEEPPTIQNDGFELSKDGTVTIDGITYKKKEDGNFIVISCDKNINKVDIREKINEEDTVTVNEIGERAFEKCTELTEIIISSTITKIGNYAFSSCNKLGTITIPYSVTEMGNSCFYDCKNLTSIKVAVSNQNFTHYNGVLYSVDGKKLYAYPYNKIDELYKLSDNLESIENDAFRGFEKLKSVAFPESLTHIGDTAFEGCKNLDNVLIPKSVTSIGANAFSNCSENLVIYGEEDSYAKTYAQENNITFKLINERPNITINEENSTNQNEENNTNDTQNSNTINDENTTNQTETNTTNTTNTTDNTNNITDIVDITGGV